MKLMGAVHAALVVVVLFQVTYYHPKLPEMVASHFDAAGRPDGWSSKGSFLGIYAASVALVMLVFHGVPLALSWLPERWINLPRKDYWLAPPRRRETLATLRRWMAWLGAGVLLFLILVFQLAIQANLAQERAARGEGFLLVLGGFLLFALGWTAFFILRFWRVPAE